MTKRAFKQFERSPRDFYATPRKAIVPLVWHLRRTGVKTFAEPCRGAGDLIHELQMQGFSCAASGDIDPRFDVSRKDALAWTEEDLAEADAVITNTPWDIEQMHPIMEHLSNLVPCWFLTYWDWPSTYQSKGLISRKTTDIVPIGRVKWIPDSPSVGFDNACWIRMAPHKDPVGTARLWPMSEFR